MNKLDKNKGVFGKVIKEEIIKGSRAERIRKRMFTQNLWYMVQLFDAYPILHSMRGEFENLSKNRDRGKIGYHNSPNFFNYLKIENSACR